MSPRVVSGGGCPNISFQLADAFAQIQGQEEGSTFDRRG